MAKSETIHQHAQRIYELDNSISELALCEGRKFEDYTAGELISAAENLLDLMSDWDDEHVADQREAAKQRRLLQNFVKKWEEA